MLIIVMQNSFVTQYLVSLKSMSQWNYWSFFRFSMKNSVFLNIIRTLIFQIFKRSSNLKGLSSLKIELIVCQYI